jgi:hypothetical protein
MTDTTMIPAAEGETFGWDDLVQAPAPPQDRAHLLRLGQLLVLGLAVVLVALGALAVLELVTGLLDDLALGTPPT